MLLDKWPRVRSKPLSGGPLVSSSPAVPLRRPLIRASLLAALPFLSGDSWLPVLHPGAPVVGPDISVSNPETRKSLEMTLGGTHFFLKNPTEFSPREAEILFAHLRRAYDKLCAYFGTEIMTLNEPHEIPIERMDSSINNVDAFLDWEVPIQFSITQREFFLNGSPKLKGFQVKDINEEVLVHELFHWFAQPMMLSLAFQEGHAHAVQRLLYASDFRNDNAAKLRENPAIQHLLDVPLDYNVMDAHGVEKERNINRLIQSLFELKWMEVLDRYPDFLRKFYEAMRILKKTKTLFTKEELVDITEKVQPGFRQSLQHELRVLADIGAQGHSAVVGSVRNEGEPHIVIVNLRMVPSRKTPEGYRAAALRPAHQAKKINVSDDTTLHPFTYDGDLTDFPIFLPIFDLPENMYKKASLKIAIGENAVPFVE